MPFCLNHQSRWIPTPTPTSKPTRPIPGRSTWAAASCTGAVDAPVLRSSCHSEALSSSSFAGYTVQEAQWNADKVGLSQSFPQRIDHPHQPQQDHWALFVVAGAAVIGTEHGLHRDKDTELISHERQPAHIRRSYKPSSLELLGNTIMTDAEIERVGASFWDGPRAAR
jgi:hypothetical protein